MELLATKKNSILKQKNLDLSVNKSNEDLTKKDCVIALRINALLYNTLQNYLSAMHNVSDYTFSSVSDIIRNILLKIETNDLSNKVAIHHDTKEYIDVTIRVSKQQKVYWSSLPNRLKRTIMEKAIIAFTQRNK